MKTSFFNSNYEIKHKNWTLSGYYLFDSLWVKQKGEWKYLLAFIRPRIKYNSFQRIDRFRDNRQHIQLLKSITPQSNKKMLITDLKPEYKVAIDKLRVKQQFCTFHLKQSTPNISKNYSNRKKEF